MKPTGTSLASAVLLLAGSGLIGCTIQTTHGAVSWTATDPASPNGQSDAQAWSRSTSDDRAEGATERQASQPNSPPPVRWSAGAIELPSDTSLSASATVSPVRAFPEEAPAPASEPSVQAGVVEVFLNGRPYGEVVDFFERTIGRDGGDLRETTTSTATLWSFRRSGGGTAHVAVRNTRPTTIEIVEPVVRTPASSARP
jgi:hypothetical protein